MRIGNKPDIVEVVRNAGIQLQQRGNRLWGLCPFHAERTPSFSVNPEKQFFYCFGCRAHGDVIHFVMRHEGISFKEALGTLGIARDVSSRPLSDEARRRRRLIEEYYDWCRRYRHECLELIGIVDKIEQAITDSAFLSLQVIADAFLARFIAQYHVWILTGSFDTEEALELYRAFL